MKKKMIYPYSDWEDENIKEVVIEFCRQFWGFLHVEETEHNVLRGNAQMNLGPDKVGTYSQKMAPMLEGSFTIGVDPAKGKFLKIEYKVDKGKFVHSKQILCKSFWSLVYKGLRGLLVPPYSRFEPAELQKATEKDIGEMKSCTNCGKSITISTEFCTFCGAKQEIKKVEILNAEDSKTCVKCSKLIPRSLKFCTFCGAKQELERIEALDTPKVKSCIKCGKSIPRSLKFCTFCGTQQEFEKLIL